MDTPCLHTLRLDIDGDAVTATLCHPERLNAVSGQLLQELVTLADWLRQRDDLLPPAAGAAPSSPLVALGAARLGSTRLIDNLEF